MRPFQPMDIIRRGDGRLWHVVGGRNTEGRYFGANVYYLPGLNLPGLQRFRVDGVKGARRDGEDLFVWRECSPASLWENGYKRVQPSKVPKVLRPNIEKAWRQLVALRLSGDF